MAAMVNSKYEACIFDMDDTLVYTADLWGNAEKAMLKHCGVAWTPWCEKLFKGLGASAVVDAARKHLSIDTDASQMLSVLRESLLEGFREQPIHALEGAIDLVKQCARFVPVAVASGSPMEAIECAMKRIDLFDQFDVVLSSEEVARGKPYPDVFLEAAKRLNADPRVCLVFEDSVPGLLAAQCAGSGCIFQPSLPFEGPFDGIERLVESWRQVDEAYLQGLLV